MTSLKFYKLLYMYREIEEGIENKVPTWAS